MSARNEHCNSIKVGDKIDVGEPNWAYRHCDVTRLVVVKVKDRGETTPLLTVVDQNLNIHDFDSGHFWVEQPAKEMTLPEVIKELGYDVKIVK